MLAANAGYFGSTTGQALVRYQLDYELDYFPSVFCAFYMLSISA